MHDTSLPFPALDRYLISLRLAAPVVFPFEHGGILRGLLSLALGQHKLPDGLIPFACESGRVRFRAGERYRIVVTLVGEARQDGDRLIGGLARVGGRVARGPAPILGGNFVVESTDGLPSVDLDAELHAIANHDELTMVLRSPLCLPRPRDTPGGPTAIFDRDFFPGSVFVDRVWRRQFFFEHGRYPRPEERAEAQAAQAAMAMNSASLVARPTNLLPVDVVVRGTGERKGSYELEGVRGQVVFHGLDERARQQLVGGMFLHVGKSIAFGLGRYTIRGTPDHADQQFAPSTSLLARTAEPEVLEDAITHLRKNLERKEAGEDSDHPAAASIPDRLALYIVGHETRIFKDKGTVVLERAGKERQDVPIEALSHVVFWGRVRATLPVLRGLAREGVPSYFCQADGTLEATFGPHEEQWPNWLAQARAADNPTLCLRFAMVTVEARLRNLAVMVVRLGWGGGSPLAAQLRDLAQATVNKQSLDSVRGLEGRGMALVFGALEDALEPEWGFTNRVRRPPPDPVNAMLSFGYSLLYQHTATALIEAGLSPRIGLVHQPRGAHLALASDLMEELRHVVESLVWTLIRRRQIKPNDFRSSPDGYYPALLTQKARRVFLDAFERRLLTQLTPEPGEEPISYRMLLVRQARQVRELVHERVSAYRPLVIHR